MERLMGIIKVLRKGEKRLLRHLYSASVNGEDKLRLRLFELIDKGEARTDEEAWGKLGGKQSSSAFAHLKHRLREDLLNVLLHQETSKRIAQANRAAAYECRKKLAQAYVLVFRNAFHEGLAVLRSAMSIADKYELVAERMLMNHLVREVVHLITDVKQMEELNKSIHEDWVLWGDILKGEELSIVIALPHLYHDTERAKSKEERVRIIGELKTLYEKSNTARIGLWYYMAYLDHIISEGKYAEGIEVGTRFITLVETSPSIYAKNNIAGVNQTLGTCYLHLGRHEEAVVHFKNADSFFPAAGNNRLVNFESLFRAQLGLGDMIAALATVQTAMQHPRIKAKAGSLPRWYFFQACAQFVSGDFDSAYRTLNRESFLSKQRDGWSVQYRVLEIMVMMEQRDEEWIGFRIDTLRKFLSRNRKLGTPRVKAVVEAMSAILRKGLDFDNLGKKVEELLRLCAEGGPGYEWDPEGAEVIRFDRWVMAKRKPKP